MPRIISLAETIAEVGTEYVSRWFEMPQSRIDAFADATDDHQFIHVDAEAAAETPFGGTIAHGFLTLSMLSAMHADCSPRLRTEKMGINYGFNKVRFMSPVPSGARIRGRFLLEQCRHRGPNMLGFTYAVTVDIEGAPKPALTATWLTLLQYTDENEAVSAASEA